MTESADETSARSEVLRLHYLEGLSIRAISRRLRMARKTVRKHLGRLPERSTRTEPVPRTSLLDPYIDVIRRELRRTPELKAPAMLERLRPLGYVGGISILRDRMRELRPTPTAEAFHTVLYAPGQAMLVDWADFGFALPGVPRRVSAFVAVLGHSRMLYLEFRLSQKQGTFLRCMERAIDFFGGVTLMDVFDNMKTVVLEHAPPRDPIFHPRFVAYAAARGFATVACTPRAAHEKGPVERGIGFVRTRFWPGRRFRDLDDLNDQAAMWRDTYANAREHDDTGLVPRLVFENVERPALSPPKSAAFDAADLDHGQVTKTFRVRFDRNRYSVPWRLVGQHVHVRADDGQVRIFLGPKCVANHPRCWDIGQDIVNDEHKRRLEERKKSAHELPAVLEATGEAGKRYFAILAATSRSVRRETRRLTFLVEIFGPGAVTQAIEEVMATGHVGIEYVEYVLRHKKKLEPAADPLRLGNPELDDIHVPEPDLALYDEATVMTRDPGEPATKGEGNDDG